MARSWGLSPAGYQRSWLRRDVVAGLTVWAVLVPESLAYATIAGLPPVVGLYAAVPALVLYALVGSSRHLVVAPMSATAALSAGVLATVAPAGDDAAYLALSAGLALATGVAALLAGLLRLGFLAALISEPVLKGFIIGLALTILVGQLPALVGVEKGEGNFFEKLWDLTRNLEDAEPLALAVGGTSLLALLLLRRFMPLVPGSLVVALGGIGAVAAFGLDGRGLEIVGTIEAGLPRLGLPDVGLEQVAALLAGGVGVMLVGFTEGLGAAKTYASREGYDIDANRELLGLGAANLGAGLSSGMVVNGSLSKTAVNGAAGARTQLSTTTTAVLTLLTLLFLTGLFEKLPEACLAAIVIAAVIELVDVSALRRLWRAGGRLSAAYPVSARADFVGAVAALLGVLIFDTLPGLAIGVAVSLVLLLARTSRPYVATLVPAGSSLGGAWVDAARHPGRSAPAGLLVVRVEAALLFANADYVRSRVRELASASPAPRLVVIDGTATPSIDVTAAQMLADLRRDLRRLDIELVLAGEVGQVRDVLMRVHPGDEPPMHPTIEAALIAHERPPAGWPDDRDESPTVRAPRPDEP